MWKFFISGIEVEEPVGWDSVQFSLERRPDAGLSYAFSDGLTFQGNGADILQTIYERNFINAITPISIVLYDSDACLEIVDQYNGEVNYKIYEQNNEGITVGVNDSGIYDRFNANRGTEIDLRKDIGLNGEQLTAYTNNTFRLHSQTLSGRARYQLQTDFTFDMYSDAAKTCGKTYDATRGIHISLAKVIDSIAPLGITARELVNWPAPSIAFPSNAQIVNISTIESLISIVGNVKGRVLTLQTDLSITACVYYTPAVDTTVNILVTILDVGLNVVSSTVIASQILPPSAGYEEFDIDFSTSAVLESGYSMSVKINLFTPSFLQAEIYELEVDTGNFVQYSLDKNELPSDCYGIYTYEYLNRIAESITGVKGVLVSDFFQSPLTNYPSPQYGDGSLTMLTNGLAIRNAIDEQNNPFPINDSWNNAFENLSKIYGLGYQIVSEAGESISIRVEHINYFYNSGQTLVIDDIQGYSRKPYIDVVYSDVELGYDESNLPEQFNGVFEFNTLRNYSITGSTNRQTFDLVSKIIAAGYNIETQRRLQFFDKTQDNKTDNEIFIICLNNEFVEIETEEQVAEDIWQIDPDASPGYTYLIGTVSEVAVVAATGQTWFNVDQSLPFGNVAYNLRVSPGRVARWNWCRFAGSLLGTEGTEVRFTTGTYNLVLQSTCNIGAVPEPFGSLVIENESLTGNKVRQDIRTAIYLPETFEFQYPQRLCEFIKLRDTPGQVVIVKQEGLIFTGILKSANNQPGSDGLTTFTLLRK